MFKGYTQWHSHISCRLTSSYGHTSMAVRLIYAEALEVGHLGRLQRERGSVTGGAGSSGSSLVPPVYPPRHRVPPTPEAGSPPSSAKPAVPS